MYDRRRRKRAASLSVILCRRPVRHEAQNDKLQTDEGTGGRAGDYIEILPRRQNCHMLGIRLCTSFEALLTLNPQLNHRIALPADGDLSPVSAEKSVLVGSLATAPSRLSAQWFDVRITGAWTNPPSPDNPEGRMVSAGCEW
jgi:hypothetical protein